MIIYIWRACTGIGLSSHMFGHSWTDWLIGLVILDRCTQLLWTSSECCRWASRVINGRPTLDCWTKLHLTASWMSPVGRQSDERLPDCSPSAHVAVGPPLDRPIGLPPSSRRRTAWQYDVGPTAECRRWAAVVINGGPTAAWQHPDSGPSTHVAVQPPLDRPIGLPPSSRRRTAWQNDVGPTAECRRWAAVVINGGPTAAWRQPDSGPSTHVAVQPLLDRPIGLPPSSRRRTAWQNDVGPTANITGGPPEWLAAARRWPDGDVLSGRLRSPTFYHCATSHPSPISTWNPISTWKCYKLELYWPQNVDGVCSSRSR